MKHHLKHMAIGAVVILAVLLAFGVNLGQALPYAILLACPLGMVAMMFFMNRQGGHNHGDATGRDPGHEHVTPTREDHERIP